MVSLVMDVPIDLDENSSRFSIDISRDLVERAISTAASLKYNRSAWSSSSGSCYDDDEATTSPIDLGGKWYWNSPVGDAMEPISPSSFTHDSGYLSRSNSMNEDKEGHNSHCLNTRSANQLHRRSITNRDPTGPQEVMVKQLQSTRELELLQELNSSALRLDPWNPSPPLISIVNADDYNSDEPLAIFEPLVPYDSQPIGTVEEALDFTMQLLQGLVFLQENKIVHGDIHSGVVMMDPTTQDGLNRVQCNIRYHLADFTHATMLRQQDDHLFCEDLRDLGNLINNSFGKNMPELSDIIRDMTSLDKLATASRILGDLEDLVARLPADRIKSQL